LLPRYIEAGFGIINPVQTSAKDMDPPAMKREFGRKITFRGGCADTQQILVFGTPEEVLRKLEIFSTDEAMCLRNPHRTRPLADYRRGDNDRCGEGIRRDTIMAQTLPPAVQELSAISMIPVHTTSGIRSPDEPSPLMASHR
jgi:hypothetical protein